MFIGVKYLVGVCYVVICINLLSTLVGILEFPNLVKLPKFTFNAGKNRKHIFIHSENSKLIRSPFKVFTIFFVTFVAIDHILSQCLVGVETKAPGLASVGYSCRTMRPPLYQLITPQLTF